MNYLSIQFIKSAPTMSHLTEDEGYEVAIMGRSNVGKSSLINALANNKKLARSSQKPGCTAYFNCYQVAENRRLIDLPGYGFARRSKQMQRHWESEFEQYIQSRNTLSAVIVIVDTRHMLKVSDVALLEFLNECQIPTLLVGNKLDLLTQQSKHQRKIQITGFVSQLSNTVVEFTSVKKKFGLSTVVDFVKMHLCM
ncbi:MAG: hypothetical protein CBD38_03725 [bacterium TMED178]|nr:MAG: hypothetical protein CBD38_03725 [bacterium TMED178]